MRDEMVTMGLPRPGKALKWVMGGLLGIWVLFAALINLMGVDEGAIVAEFGPDVTPEACGLAMTGGTVKGEAAA